MRERERERVGHMKVGGGAEEKNLQADAPLSVEVTWGSILGPMSSGPELKPRVDAQPTKPPRCPTAGLFIKNMLVSSQIKHSLI